MLRCPVVVATLCTCVTILAIDQIVMNYHFRYRNVGLCIQYYLYILVFYRYIVKIAALPRSRGHLTQSQQRRNFLITFVWIQLTVL